MTSDELKQLRLEKWKALTGRGLTTERLLEFVQEAGFCPFAAHPGLALPSIDSLAGTPVGAADAPQRELTASERSLASAHELLEYHIRHRRIVEVDLWKTARLYVPAELLGYLYVSVGDRKPEKDFLAQRQRGHITGLAAEIYQLLLDHGSLSRSQLREKLGTDRTSVLGIDRAVGELAQTLKAVRVGSEQGDPVWQPTLRAFPKATAMLEHVSKLEAAAALISKYLDLMLVVSEEAIAEFFSPIFARSRTHSVLIGLEAAREVVADHVEGRPAWRLAYTVEPRKPQG